MDEAASVLESLRLRHPDLASEIEELALAVLERVDAPALGAELSRRLQKLDIFDAIEEDPRDSSYTPVWEMAQHTLDTTMAPYLEDLQRKIEVGLKEAAQATCLGIVIGLYHAREGYADDSLLAQAPDFCEKEAYYVVDILARQSGKLHRHRWMLPEDARSSIPEWSRLFPGAARPKR